MCTHADTYVHVYTRIMHQQTHRQWFKGGVGLVDTLQRPLKSPGLTRALSTNMPEANSDITLIAAPSYKQICSLRVFWFKRGRSSPAVTHNMHA